MNTTSFDFIVFLVVTLFLFAKVKPSLRYMVLLAASLVFAVSFSINLLVFTFAFASFNYFFGQLIFAVKNEKYKKLFYLTGITVNIGILVFYKYINFLLDNLSQLLSFTPVKFDFVPLEIIIPIGISFYTFQCVGYLINIYRGIDKPESQFLKFYLYIIYFPKLLSGPIEESKKFLPQLDRAKITESDVKEGVKLILFGLFKKIVIADRLLVMREAFHQNMDYYSGFPLLFLFFVQPIILYCDFSGYTDIALGISRLFGIKLTENFERPFFATSVSMFWRRWHMSLSNWCNNYIFKRISFEKRKWKDWASVYAVFITFLIVGIWHGANWNFVVLGLLQALAINYEFFTRKFRVKLFRNVPVKINTFFSRIVVYLFFCFTILLFFSTDMTDAVNFIKHCLNMNSYRLTGYNILISKFEISVAMVAFMAYFVLEYRKESNKPFPLLTAWLKWLLYGILLAIIIVFGLFASNTFIYAQF